MGEDTALDEFLRIDLPLSPAPNDVFEANGGRPQHLARRGDKDTLALGNITGAMVFGTAFPVSVGLLLTPWRLHTDAFAAAIVALVAAALLYVTLRIRGRFTGALLLLQGAFYAGYVAFVVSRL